MNVLLSIRPKYVDEIVKGNKRYEFRKSVFKKRVNQVWIYATFPVKKIVAAFVTGEIVKGSPDNLWADFQQDSGMDEQEFFSYFQGKEVGFALELRDVVVLQEPIDPESIFPRFSAPQSFCYFDSNFLPPSLKRDSARVPRPSADERKDSDTISFKKRHSITPAV